MTQSRYDTSVAADRAAIQAGMADAGITNSTPPNGQGMRLFMGTFLNTITPSGTGATWEFAMELDARADEVGSLRLALGRGLGGAIPLLAYVKPIGALTDLDTTFGGTQVTFDSATAAYSLNSGSTNRGSYLVSDEMQITPVARTDGGGKALVAVRVFLNTSAAVNLLASSGISFDNWAARPDGLVRIRRNSTSGNQVAATTGWALDSAPPGFGFIYSTIRPTVTVMSGGDSIAWGLTDTYQGAGFFQRALDSLNAANTKDAQFSGMNLSWSGSTSTQYVDHIRDAFSAGIIPSILVFPIGTVNDTGGTLSATDVTTWKARTAQIYALCAAYGVVPIAYTIPPVGSSVRAWGTSDSFRQAYNAAALASATTNGRIVVDIATAFSGVTTGGQVQPNAAYTDDSLHPNATGSAALATVLAPYVKVASAQAMRSQYRTPLIPALSTNFDPKPAGSVTAGTSGRAADAAHVHPVRFAPGATNAPVNNGDVTMELTSNTVLTFKAKGSDGTIRSGTITLA